MNHVTRRFLAGSTAVAVSATLAATVSTSATASSDRGDDRAPAAAHRPDNRPGPLTERQDTLRTKALEMLANGSAELKRRRGGGATVSLGKKPGSTAPTAYEFPVNRTDKIFTVLSEFSDVSHNSIPEPDRTQDNSTVWRSNFDAAYYENLFNGPSESMTDYYRTLSSGKYSVTSTVEDWVAVPGSLASYGANDVEDDGGSWQFIADTVDAWYDAQLAAGRTAAQVDAYLATLDVWDRYDADNDGEFNEPDGYIDHFQAVHAGEGEEAGASPDAIWSHRWYVNGGDYGQTGPGANKLGGTQIGSSGFWIGDYTVEPENGGLGVFAHEYGHDLGLPDYYDTAGGENGTAFWTLMSSGSWLGNGAAAGEGIGTTPGLMGPEEKLELGWLDYSEVDPGQASTVNLGPSQNTYDDPGTTANEGDQAVKVNLPALTTTTAYTTPPQGSNAWWTGRGDGLNNTLTRSVDASGSITVTASAWYEIEAGYDYLYAETSTDGGKNWTTVGSPVDGSSGNRWKGLRYSYTASGPHLFRFRYSTDGGVNEAGAFLDAIAIKSSTGTFTDGAEDGTNGWTADGWKISTGSETVTTPRYYLIENRQHVGYDRTLGTGPYNFSQGLTKPNWVEFFSFRPGMVVWYVNDAFADNNVATHPGAGSALPVDARPAPFSYSDGSRPSNRRQPFDAAFGLQSVPQTCLHKEVLTGKGKNQAVQTLEACAAADAGIATFDDSDPLRYWSAANPQNSVKVAGVGVKATVTADNGGFLTVDVSNPAR